MPTAGNRTVSQVPVEDIVRYEQGYMTEEEIVAMFQSMIDSGVIWHLQGHYGRTAKNLIDAGYCHPPRQNNS